MAFALVFLTKKYFDFQIALIQFVEQAEKKKKIAQVSLTRNFIFYAMIYCLRATVCGRETP